MPRSLGMEEWVRKLGERIGAELGQIIAKSARRTIESSIDVERSRAGWADGGGAASRPVAASWPAGSRVI